MLVDGEGVQRGGVKGFAGETHRGGEVGELGGRESALVDGHEEGGDLGVSDFVGECERGGGFAAGFGELLFAVEDDCVDEVLDFSFGELAAIALLDDDVEGVEGGSGGWR